MNTHLCIDNNYCNADPNWIDLRDFSTDIKNLSGKLEISTNIFIAGLRLSERKKLFATAVHWLSVDFFWIYAEYIASRIVVLFSPTRSVDP